MRQEDINKIKELNDRLIDASYHYYVLDDPIMTDKEYDAIYDELEALEKETGYVLSNSVTHNVQGKLLDGFKKVTHSKPMLSAAKTKDENVIKDFVKGQDYYCSFKLDGCTTVIIYEDGNLKQAITRGDGYTGEDVTETARMIRNLPANIPYKERLELRGECIMPWDNFKKVNATLQEPYSHPRNLAAGTLRQLDTWTALNRGLLFIVFEVVSDIYNGNAEYNSKWNRLGLMDKFGFETVKRCYGDVESCINQLNPENYPYPVDGLVFEYNNNTYSKSLGATGHHDRCRLALKWADATQETVLRRVEWEVGKSGAVTPVAVFDGVDLDGAFTTRASLHNLSIVKKLELGIGDSITVYRANMVIPQVDDNLTRSNTLSIPTVCPSCGQRLKIDKSGSSEFLICDNPYCKSKVLARFVAFVDKKGTNIDSLSEATLQLLIDEGYITNFKSIYHLKKYFNDMLWLPGFGRQSINKLLNAIEKSRNIKLENYITALGIDGVGFNTAKQISKACDGNFNVFVDYCEKGCDFSFINGIGCSVCNSIKEWYENDELSDCLEEEFNFIVPEATKNNTSTSKLNGLRFCITGSFSRSREELKAELEALGAVFVSGVSKKLDVLFVGENAGSKYAKAVELGIKISNEDELMELLKNS